MREQAKKQIIYVMNQQKESEKAFVERTKLQDLSFNWQAEQAKHHEKTDKENIFRAISP